MSGYIAGLKEGDKIYYKEKWRVIKSYFFVSAPVHNSDLPIILFADGTTTGSSGLSGIKTKEDLEQELEKISNALSCFEAQPS